MAPEPAVSLRSHTWIPSAAVSESYHKVELQRRSDQTSSVLSHPFCSKMRPDAHTAQLLETCSSFPVLTFTPAGTGSIAQDLQCSCSETQATILESLPTPQSCLSAAPPLPVQAPIPPAVQMQRAPARLGRSQEGSPRSFLNVNIIFQAPCRGWRGIAMVMEATWNPGQTGGS